MSVCVMCVLEREVVVKKVVKAFFDRFLNIETGINDDDCLSE